MILPDKNEKDLEDVSPAVKESLTFHFVNEIDQVIDIVFGPDLRERARQKVAEAAPGKGEVPAPAVVTTDEVTEVLEDGTATIQA